MNGRPNFFEKPKEDIWGFVMHLIILVVGFLCSTASILGGLIPFGISFLAAISKKYLPAAVFGVSLGYLIFIMQGGFVYIAAVFAIATIKLILGSTPKITKSPLFPALITFLTLMITGIVLSVSYNENFITQMGQAAIASAISYFLAIAFKIDLELSVGLDIRENVSVLVLISVLLLALYRVQIAGLNLGRILASVFILAIARFGKASYGAVAGTVIGFTLSLYDGNLYKSAGIFGFSGLISGLFSRLGFVGMVCSYLICTIVSVILMGDFENLPRMFFEGVIGSGFFLMLPGKITKIISIALSPRPEITNPDTLKGALIMRLEFAGGALKDIFKTVEDVALRLKKINSPDFEKTLNDVENDVCTGCSLRRHCWETAKEITAEDTLRLWGRLKSGADQSEIPLKMNCLREKEFESSVRQHCEAYDSRINADRRISEVRGVISDQFSAIADMLFDLCDEFKYEIHHDAKAAENIILTMKNLGYHTVYCTASNDKFGHLSADIHIKGVADKVLNKAEILKALNLALEKDFDTPTVSTGDDEAFISVTEKPIFSIEMGVSQIPEEKGKLCGDSYKYFCDGKGRFVIILSDGMGTGGRAAVDSAMVSGLMSRMISSGFGYDCSLKIVNSSMLFKSTDESLSTVDIVSIDLFSGECELRKAGAAPTLIRKKGRMGKANSTSLPPGILRNVAFDFAKIKLKDEDIIVMLSDGATFDGTEWISSIINDWTIGSAQRLADEIAHAARRRRDDGHNDDITVLTAILKEKR